MKDIPGFEEKYAITEDGNVWSYRSKRFLKSYISDKGYRRISLRDNGRDKSCFVHRLVASTYLPNPENKQFVNHKDRDRGNNHLTNIEWCTSQYNVHYAMSLGVHINMQRRKLTPEKRALAKRLRSEGLILSEIAAQVGVTTANVSKFLRGDSYKIL